MEITGLLLLYNVLMFVVFVVLIKYIGGYILNKHKPFGWIGSAIVAALIYVGQMLISNVLMGLGTTLFGG